MPVIRLLLGCLAAAAVAAGCSSAASTHPAARPTQARSAPSVVCAWYTPTQPQGQQVILTATGSQCGAAASVVEFAAVKLRRVWYSTSADFDNQATLIAQLHRGAMVVKVFMFGNPPSPTTMQAAGNLANDFQAAGWQIDLPAGEQGPVPSISYSTALAGGWRESHPLGRHALV